MPRGVPNRTCVDCGVVYKKGDDIGLPIGRGWRESSSGWHCDSCMDVAATKFFDSFYQWKMFNNKVNNENF